MNFQDAMIEVSKGKMVVDPTNGSVLGRDRDSIVFFDYERTNEGLECLKIQEHKQLMCFNHGVSTSAFISEEAIASDGWQLHEAPIEPSSFDYSSRTIHFQTFSGPDAHKFVPAHFTLPTWEQANENIEAGHGTALDTFIVIHEPHTENQSREFREQLLAALIEYKQ